MVEIHTVTGMNVRLSANGILCRFAKIVTAVTEKAFASRNPIAGMRSRHPFIGRVNLYVVM